MRCTRIWQLGFVAGPFLESWAIREGYQFGGCPDSPGKLIQRERVAEVQGAMVNGRTGKVRTKPSQVMKHVNLVIRLLQDGKASQR